jgi:hypothetical protein
VHVVAHYGLERSGVLAGTPITPTVLTPAMLLASAAREGVSLRLFADVSGDEGGTRPLPAAACLGYAPGVRVSSRDGHPPDRPCRS